MPVSKRSSDACPTCGQAVSVQASDEGTSYYVPVAEARHAGASAGQAAYKAENERLREALRPFATFAEDRVEPCDGFPEHGQWTEFGVATMRDRIIDWFGPSDFKGALDALKAR